MDRINFIDDLLLRDRIENVLDDILNLEGLIDEQEKSDMQSCLRKTVIIYTASVIEALLAWKLKKEIDGKYSKPRVNHPCSKSIAQILGGLKREVDTCLAAGRGRGRIDVF